MVNHSLHIENLHVWLKDQHILKEVSFGLEKGKITALIGPNGAGKSTCMKVMAGLIKPQKGLFHYQGKAQNDFRELRKYGGFLIESPAFYNYLTASKNLNMLQKIRDAKKSTDELLKIVGLQHTGKKKISQFSKGMKQRLGIAQALIGEPDFLVLDEPFHGLDIEVKEELILLIRNLAVKEGKSILISSHLLSDLETLADDFVLLNQGKIHYKGSVLGYEEDKNQLRYSFRNPTTGISEAFLAKWKLKRTSVNSISGELSEEESQKVLVELVKTGRVPNQIEIMSKLTQKYKEIAE